MSSFNKQEYLDLIHKLLDQQYAEDEETENIESDHWIPAESPLKDKIPISVQNGTMDLSDAKKDKISTALRSASNFTVGHFIIKVERNLFDSKRNPIVGNPTFNIELYEERFKTPSGNPCRMTYKIDIKKDSRFNQCKWVSHFSYSNKASNVSNEIFVEVVRWMQALKRMTAFL